MKISLIGYMGSGKSTVGRLLAGKLNLPFLDLDDLIVQKSQKSIAEIFKISGEIKFRQQEREILREILEQNEDFVLALGGGTPAYYDNIDLINENSLAVYLRLSPVEIVRRLENETDKRPLLSHLKPEEILEFIAKHLFERRPYYEKAKIILDIQQLNPEAIAEKIITHLHSQ